MVTRDGGPRELKDVVLIEETAAGGLRAVTSIRALRRELLAQWGTARVGFVLGDQMVAAGPDVGHGQHRVFGQFALDREIEVLRIGQNIVNVVARIVGKGFVNIKAERLI